MKIVEKHDATRTLADYAEEIESGLVVVTEDGQPVAALVPIENADLETVALGASQQFQELIQRSRVRVQQEGGVSGEDMRKRLN